LPIFCDEEHGWTLPVRRGLERAREQPARVARVLDTRAKDRNATKYGCGVNGATLAAGVLESTRAL
jgi:hypothetical protein